jgi:hypothetical protein
VACGVFEDVLAERRQTRLGGVAEMARAVESGRNGTDVERSSIVRSQL